MEEALKAIPSQVAPLISWDRSQIQQLLPESSYFSVVRRDRSMGKFSGLPRAVNHTIRAFEVVLASF